MSDKLTLLRFEILRRLGSLLLPPYRFKWPQMAWWNDEAFNRYLDRFKERSGMNTDRRWMLLQLMRLVESVPGDTAECGVFRGAGSYVICAASKASGRFSRHHHVFDSFEGLSAPAAVDGSHWTAGDLACAEDVVARALADFPNVVLHKGWIPARFPDVDQARFAFVHIDVDIYQPTLDSLAFFYPRVEPGGIVVCDDYGFTSCPGATRAVDEYLRDKPEKMVALSCGGGFLIKGCVTTPSSPASATPLG